MLTIADRPPVLPNDVHSLHSAVQAFLDAKFPAVARPGNAFYIDQKSMFKKFCTVITDRPIDHMIIDEAIDITQMFCDYRRIAGIGNVRLDNDRRYISQLFSWCMKRRLVPFRGNPTERKWLDLPKPDMVCKPPLSDKDVAALLSATRSTVVHPNVVLCLACGVRPIESCRVEWDHFDFDRKTVRIFGKKRERIIPLCNWAVDEVKVWRTQHMWHQVIKRVVNRRLSQVRKTAGIPASVTFQGMRRTFAFKCFVADVPAAKVASIMGNSVAVIDRHYVQFARLMSHDAVNLIQYPVLEEPIKIQPEQGTLFEM
jgi:integrase